MGLGRIFAREGPIVYFPGVAKKISAGECISDIFSFETFETKKTTFFAKNMTGKYQIPNSLGAHPF